MDGVHCNERLSELLISLQGRGRYFKVVLWERREIDLLRPVKLVQNRRRHNLRKADATHLLVTSFSVRSYSYAAPLFQS